MIESVYVNFVLMLELSVVSILMFIEVGELVLIYYFGNLFNFELGDMLLVLVEVIRDEMF